MGLLWRSYWIFHLIPLVVTISFHARLSYIYIHTYIYVYICIYIYIYAILRILFPCPIAIPVTDKILTTFSLSVWLTFGIVLQLTTAVFWCARKGPYRSVCNETHTYQSLSHCFHDDGAVFVVFSTAAEQLWPQIFLPSVRLFLFRY